jgi:ABC-type multidrug transport system fused ATPase/permease subunit
VFRLFQIARELGVSRRALVGLLVLDTSRTIVELAAIVTLAPLVQYLQVAGNVSDLVARHKAWAYLSQAYGYLGLSITLGSLLLTSYTFILLRQGLGYAVLMRAAQLRAGMAAQIRQRMFRSFLSVSLDEQEKLSSGGFGNTVIAETDAASNTLMQLIRLMGFAILLSAYVVTMLFVSWQMTIVAVVLGIAVAYPLRRLLGKSHAAGRQLKEVNEALSQFLIERIASLRLIRMSGMEVVERSEFDRIADERRERLINIDRLAARLSMLVEPILAGIAFIFLYVGFSYFGLGLESIALFMLIMLRLVPLGRDILTARQTVLAFEPQLHSTYRRLSVLSGAREPAGGKRVFAELNDKLSIRDVTFSYPDAQAPALCGLTLDIAAGQVTALVGPSGGGKSTLVDLLPRLRTPQGGMILFDGEPIESFSTASLRDAIAFAPQTPQFFDVTVGDHIRFGRSDADDRAVREAAADAGALEFIDQFPEGFDTRLGERGLRLSGGQRQRLDLARVLVKRAPVLIFDEPTSALDAASEAAFRSVIEKIKAARKQTVIIIGHRLSTVAIADRVFVIDAGRVVSEGTHAELRDREGWYRDAWRDYAAGSRPLESVS